MNFQGLIHIENYQNYLDQAFKNGSKAASASKSQSRAKTRLEKSRKAEIARVESVTKSLSKNLENIVKKYPNFDQLDPFYQALTRSVIDVDNLKKSLGSLLWAKRRVLQMKREALRKIKGARTNEDLIKARRAFTGRVSSILKQVSKNLAFLEQARKILKRFPALKTKKKTIVLAGAPNVGKSTLLARLTSSKPQIAHYPFTTKELNVGYDDAGRQYVDTPGLLDRPLHKRNPIEKQAILALKHLADLIIFVFDPSESCGYTMQEQQKLLNEIKREFKAPILTVSNKSDVGGKRKHSIAVSALEGKGIDDLREAINSVLAVPDKSRAQDNVNS
ncbi:GTP-binding protein [Candidatus Woesearchaeota archaeon]|nr:MAG: GTP-binding protein [Candidatus Woesearchaeota archaeon]